jgi:hypothetical protein
MITRSTILLSAAIVLGAASSAMASNPHGDDSFSSAQSPSLTQIQNTPAAAFAQAPGIVVRRNAVRGVNRAFDSNGSVVGADPDAFIRNELMRDPPGRGD